MKLLFNNLLTQNISSKVIENLYYIIFKKKYTEINNKFLYNFYLSIDLKDLLIYIFLEKYIKLSLEKNNIKLKLNFNKIYNLYTPSNLDKLIIKHLTSNYLYINKIYPFFNSLDLQLKFKSKIKEIQYIQLISPKGYTFNETGFIFKTPIINNVFKGFSFYELYLSMQSTKKTILDTVINTSSSGYLTRKLVEIGYNIKLKEYTCNTLKCFYLKNQNFLNIKGNLINFNKIINKNKILLYNLNKIYYRNIFNCILGKSICNLCLFNNFQLNKQNINIGILIGQTIGEPGTQMILKTFHTGGVFKSNIKIINKIENLNVPFYNIKYNIYILLKKNLNFKHQTNYNINNILIKKYINKLNIFNLFIKYPKNYLKNIKFNITKKYFNISILYLKSIFNSWKAYILNNNKIYISSTYNLNIFNKTIYKYNYLNLISIYEIKKKYIYF